jgi:hypothetical protein
MPKITISNIASFIEGTSKEAYDKLIGLPVHIQEQVAYRHEKCKDDCIPQGGCIHCGCNPIGKHFVNKSCNNGERFPDLMDKEAWDLYKIEVNE